MKVTLRCPNFFNVYLIEDESDFEIKTLYRNIGNGEEMFSVIDKKWIPWEDEDVFFERRNVIEITEEEANEIIKKYMEIKLDSHKKANRV